MKIGILRETKNPPDRRVPLTPEQCSEISQNYQGMDLVVQSSVDRCFNDNEYRACGIRIVEDVSDRDVLLGVKEVAIPALIPGKTYLFFSHTAKEQPYNRDLLRTVARLGLTLIDYEYLTRQDNTRVVAFGRWAGIVGTYNGLKAYGERFSQFQLDPAWKLNGLDEMKERLAGVDPGSPRIILTGGGRVAHGAVEILHAAGIREVTPGEFLSTEKQGKIFSRLDPWHYARRRGGEDFDFDHFVIHPGEYENSFLPYAMASDMYIACHFWDPEAPILLSREDLGSKANTLKVIADISCDINGPIASTIRASTIADPLYGYNPLSGKETASAFDPEAITVMAVDNLPGELPRDASSDFGKALISNVIPSLAGNDSQGIIRRATIIREGKLTKTFSYLEAYLGN